MNGVIKKALSVAVSGQSIHDYLPEPLAAEVIDFIREINIVRRLVPSFTLNSRTWRKPKRAGGMTGYHIPDGVTATLSSFSSTSVTWEAKKLMSFVMVDEEAIEDSQPDVVAQVLADFGDAMGEAEEQAFLNGDPTHLATAPTPDSATSTNWYNRDSRLAFEGIFTVAASASAATSVAAGGAVFNEDFVNTALFNLGKYGRNKGQLIGILSPNQASNVRSNDRFKDASVTGMALASFITGLGSAGEGAGIVTNIYGVTFYEAPFAPANQTVMFWKNSPQIGDRRRIRFRSEDVIESEQRKYVVSERIAFNYNYRDALVLIDDLDTTVA